MSPRRLERPSSVWHVLMSHCQIRQISRLSMKDDRQMMQVFLKLAALRCLNMNFSALWPCERLSEG